MIRELWHRHMDARRAWSALLTVIALVLGTVALAVTPGFVALAVTDPGGLAKFGPVVGAALGMGVRGYAFHRRPGTRDGLRWALAQCGLMALAVLGLFAAATAIQPIVRPNPMLGGDAWVGLLAFCLVLGAISSALWERNRRRQRTALILLIAVCLIVVGLIGLRAGGLRILLGTPSLAIGIIGLFLAVVQGWSDLMEAAVDPVA